MPRVPESFYEPDGDVYVATERTRQSRGELADEMDIHRQAAQIL
jgi:hypothetical protein